MDIKKFNLFGGKTRPRFTLSAFVWKSWTALQKIRIHFEDAENLFSYPKWLEQQNLAWEAQDEHLHAVRSSEAVQISVIIHNCEHSKALERTLASVQSLTVPVRETLIFGDEKLLSGSGYIENNRLSEKSNLYKAHPFSSLVDELNLVTGEWILFLNPGDVLVSHFTEIFLEEISRRPYMDVLYWDEDQIDSTERLHTPWFKPGWSPELLLSKNLLHHALYRREVVIDLLSKNDTLSFESIPYLVSETTEKIIHIPHVLLHNSQANLVTERDENRRRLRLVEEHLSRRGFPKVSGSISNEGNAHLAWNAGNQLVSIIIPTRDNLECLSACLNSLRSNTDYPNYEVILIDTGSQNPDTWDYYNTLVTDPKFCLEKYNETFNYSVVNNLGASLAKGDVLVFLNNDVEALDSTWLRELVMWAQVPEVGVVGAKLLYPNRRIQHAGIVVGLEGHASHVFGGQPDGITGPFGSVDWYRNYSAVTGACLATRRDVFEQVGGFDEQYQLVFNDVEFCLRVIEHSYRVVYNPYARLTHHEGKSRGRYIPSADIELGYQHMKAYIEKGDPYFNPNLSQAVRTPTLKRAWEEDPIKRLDNIRRWYGPQG